MVTGYRKTYSQSFRWLDLCSCFICKTSPFPDWSQAYVSFAEKKSQTGVKTSGRKTCPKHAPSLIGLECGTSPILHRTEPIRFQGEETKSIKREANCTLSRSNYNVLKLCLVWTISESQLWIVFGKAGGEGPMFSPSEEKSWRWATFARRERGGPKRNGDGTTDSTNKNFEYTLGVGEGRYLSHWTIELGLALSEWTMEL